MASNNNKTNGTSAPSKKDAKKPLKDVKPQLSEEDEKKKQELELIVERIQDPKPSVQKVALETLRSELRSTSSSVTSVPKPLKFLGPHYEKLKNFYATLEAGEVKTMLADTMSVLAMTMAQEGSRDSLKFKLEGTLTEMAEWGHEYMRFLAGDISQEYQARIAQNPDLTDNEISDLLKVTQIITPLFIRNHAEPDACDLLMEVEKLPSIIPLCDKNNYNRVCLYLTSASKFFLEPDNTSILKIVHTIYLNQKKYPEALRIAIALNEDDLITSTYNEAKEDKVVQKQMAFMLARHNAKLKKPDTSTTMETDEPVEDVQDEEEEEVEENKISNVIGNSKLSGYYQFLGKALDSLEAKTPEDIYKSHLTETRSTLTQNIDSARQNLASTFVNAFVNAGFGTDKLMTDEGTKWIYKNKDVGMMSAAASLGMIYQWNCEDGLNEIDKRVYSGDNYIKAGALMGIGIVHTGATAFDYAYTYLSEYVNNNSREVRIGAILGIGIAYAGSRNPDVSELLLPIVADADQPIDVVVFAALTLGLVFSGTCNEDISTTIWSVFTERDEKTLSNPLVRFLCLAWGLVFLGKQEAAEAVIEITKTVNDKVAKYAQLAVETCAYFGTGNVLKIQELLKICGEHIEQGKENKHQALAVLGIAMIAMGEDLGSEMTVRSFDHILQYGDPVVKRAVPLALAFLNISNPKMTIMDTLSKLSHDADPEVADGAILALGLIGAGTSNARIAQLLRQLSSYYAKDPNHLFMVRVAQGILFMGKGLISMSPYYSDRFIPSPVAISGLLTVFTACLDMKNIIFGQYHYLLYFFACAMRPRMLITVDENLKPLPVSVRVGTAVDVVAQAGRPKTITGFQTHNTPVLLQHDDRAELATEEYLPMSSILEDVVILRKNPEFQQ